MNFIWLCQQTLDLPLFAWPVTLSLLIFVGISLFYTGDRGQLVPARNLLLFGALMIFPLATVALGAIFQAPLQMEPATHIRSWQHRSDSAAYPIDLLFCLHILYAIALVVLMKGLRLFAAAVSLLTIWLTCSAAFIAGMSISGEWL